jgi:hypothetical protein
VSRVYVIVEGATEESFVAGPLAEALWPHQVYLTPIIVGVPGHKGGRTNYARVQRIFFDNSSKINRLIVRP